MRIEHDLLGELEIEDNAYYGIHTVRALQNFHITGIPIHKELVEALVTIKKAAAITNRNIKSLDENVAEAIILACDEILAGAFRDQFVVDCMQGGAGTSANMNVNEVIANRAIEHLGGKKGDYHLIHPLDHVNMHQSTNDVFPTAVRIAAIRLLKPVTESFANLQTALQEKEEAFSRIIKAGRTQLQDAVPVTLGQEFGAWAQAISRDRWRLYKAEERLRQVNIGGTAIGTGLNAPRSYIFTMIERLRDLTGISLARTDYMMDPTQNCDVFVEVSGLLKTAAVNLSKIANDLRLLSSGPYTGIGEITLPPVQAGSSIMPGKINPVIPEAVNQAAFQIMANDMAITLAAMSGQLELNAFLPVLSKNLFEALDILKNILPLFTERCIEGIVANADVCRQNLDNSTVMLTALTNYIGYDKATEAALLLKETGKSIKEIIIENNWMDEKLLDDLLRPERLTSPSSNKEGK
ncbi:aspartate ammonia-lyase [Acetobacterium paludosum]|uniref:Aspartate ammonia-lyase n=1 Tax=Acetobacterium paludosum TaxID=52693 RepID=A0A923HVE0_9FIRM|nr:aspartate ammonia-lyase [Acetobacterium paludosum]MBC3888377.1 aspartate ammonia-lyase [Acetobacterium paludosum]